MEVQNGNFSTYQMKRIWKLHAEARINCFTWYQYSSWFIGFCAFKIWYCKRQQMYCFLPFEFINVIIFVVNPFGSYLTFVGAHLEYPNLLRHDRSNWSELRYFNFKPNFKLWWRRAQDFNGSSILVASGGFRGFSRFLGFEISKLRALVCITIFIIISNMNYC